MSWPAFLAILSAGGLTYCFFVSASYMMDISKTPKSTLVVFVLSILGMAIAVGVWV